MLNSSKISDGNRTSQVLDQQIHLILSDLWEKMKQSSFLILAITLSMKLTVKIMKKLTKKTQSQRFSKWERRQLWKNRDRFKRLKIRFQSNFLWLSETQNKKLGMKNLSKKVYTTNSSSIGKAPTKGQVDYPYSKIVIGFKEFPDHSKGKMKPTSMLVSLPQKVQPCSLAQPISHMRNQNLVPQKRSHRVLVRIL